MNKPEWSTQRVARYLDIAPSTVYRLYRRDLITGTQDSPRAPIAYDGDSVQTYRATRAKKAPPVTKAPDEYVDWWTTGRAARHLRVAQSTVILAVARGDLRGVQARPKAYIRIDPQDAERYRQLREQLARYSDRKRKEK